MPYRKYREKKYETKYREAFKVFQEKIGITFTDEKLLIQAFTHSSYVNEHRKKPHEDNERLEFLGDAVLELTVSQYLFQKIIGMIDDECESMKISNL